MNEKIIRKPIFSILGIVIASDGILSLFLKPNTESFITQLGRITRTIIGISIIILAKKL